MTGREDLFRVAADLALAVQGAATYPESHPKAQALMLRLYESIREDAARLRGLSIGFFADHIVVDEQPFLGLNATLERLNERMRDKGIEKVIFRDGVTFGELKRFVCFVAGAAGNASEQRWEGISYGRIESVGGARAHAVGLTAPTAANGILAGVTNVLRDALVALATESRRSSVEEGRDIVSAIMKGLRQEGLLIDRLLRLQSHDDYTATHALNVSILVVAFAARMGLSEPRVRELGLAALLHDVGKEAVSSRILNKPGRLEPREFDEVKLHPVAGARILRKIDCGTDLPMIVAFEHHIKYDRSGYPKTRSTDPLHTASYMTQLADVYDALRSFRKYQPSIAKDETIAIMTQGRGTEFEPALFDTFLETVA